MSLMTGAPPLLFTENTKGLKGNNKLYMTVSKYKTVLMDKRVSK